MRVVLFFELFAAVAVAQQATVKSIADVELGMRRQAVLSGLSKHYEVVKIGEQRDESGEWLVVGKNPDKYEKATVSFLRDQVCLIKTALVPPMQKDAVDFAEEFFLLLRGNSEPSKEVLATIQKTPPPPGIAQMLLNGTYIEVPMQMWHDRYSKFERMTMAFTLADQQYEIVISRSDRFEPQVEINRVKAVEFLKSGQKQAKQ
jgi:hypothetical protein